MTKMSITHKWHKNSTQHLNLPTSGLLGATKLRKGQQELGDEGVLAAKNFSSSTFRTQGARRKQNKQPQNEAPKQCH